MASTPATLDKIVALCKRRGFIFKSSEIYGGGLNGLYDFGPLGVVMKKRIEDMWLKAMDSYKEETVLIDGALIGPHDMWKASGHLDNFSDPLTDCINCKKRYRSDEPDFNIEKPCPSCGVKNWTESREFMLMFKTQIGAMSSSEAQFGYMRPETAQTIFVNFKNVISSTRIKFPFAIAQIGKSFRNEINPRQFLFRVREFEQMELEFFCHPDKSDEYFDIWLKRRWAFYEALGLNKDKLRLRAHEPDELAHYSKNCTDVEYEFPFGWKELEGIAHRGDHDLKQHTAHSGKDLSYFDQVKNEKFIPHVVECSVGVGRLFLTLLFDAYREDEIEGDKRVYLALEPKIAPISAAVLPITKKLSEPASKLFMELKQAGFKVQFDDSGSIGKRYRRQDEIGTPLCFTFDFDSLDDNCVTVRNRDTLEQERISIDTAKDYLHKVLTS